MTAMEVKELDTIELRRRVANLQKTLRDEWSTLATDSFDRITCNLRTCQAELTDREHPMLFKTVACRQRHSNG